MAIRLMLLAIKRLWNFCFNCYQADATGGHSPSGLSDHLPHTSMYEAC